MLKMARRVKKLSLEKGRASEREEPGLSTKQDSHYALLHHSTNDNLHAAKEAEEVEDGYDRQIVRLRVHQLLSGTYCVTYHRSLLRSLAL